MTKTTNLELNKPDVSDFYDIAKQNENMDIIDEEIHDLSENVEELKKSVSDGKTLVANAITEKGVPTATDSSFYAIAENISSITTKPTGLVSQYNIFTQEEEPTTKDGIWVQTKSKFENVIIDNHVLNEGGVWVKTISDLPISFSGRLVAYVNGEIHILSSSNSHYKHDGVSWKYVGTLPKTDSHGIAMNYNGELHYLCYDDSFLVARLYKWNNQGWTNICSGSLFMSDATCLTYNNELHIIGAAGGSKSHYKVDGEKYTKVSELPFTAYFTSAVVYNGKIHLLGSGTDRENKHCTWNGSEWEVIGDMPYKLHGGGAVVYNGEIHIFGGSHGSTNHYKYDGTAWNYVSTIPYEAIDMGVVVIGNSIVLFGGETEINKKDRVYFTSPENIYDPHTLILQRGHEHNGVYLTSITDTSAITGENNRFISSFDDVWYFGETAFEMTAPMYYGDGTKWIKFKN